MKPIRISAKALIVDGDRVLLTHNRDEQGSFWLLPGGGQEPGETLAQAVQREVKEEAGVSVSVGALRFVREYIGKNHEFAASDAGVHQVELVFSCTIVDGEPQNGALPDSMQIGVEWVPRTLLPTLRFYPHALRAAVAGEAAAVYFGDVN